MYIIFILNYIKIVSYYIQDIYILLHFLIILKFSVVDDGGESWKYSLRVNISYSIIYKYS